MREIIQKVVTTEAEAKQLVEAARREASQLLDNARLRASEVIEQAQRESGRLREATLAAAEARARSEKAGLLAQAEAEIERTITLDEGLKEQMVSEAVKWVCGQGTPAEIKS